MTEATEDTEVFMKGIKFLEEHNEYEEKDKDGNPTDIREPPTLFNDEGFIAYPFVERKGESVKYYESYPVNVLNKDNVQEFVESLGKCIVVTGGSKFDENGIDPYFSEYSPEIMFRVGVNVGLRWKEFEAKGFKNVCCGCMTEDTAYNKKDTSFSFDWLFPHGFALGYDLSEKLIDSGLAYYYDGGTKPDVDWCRPLDEQF